MSSRDAYLLPHALAGERNEVTPEGVGRVSWYQDAPVATAGGRPLLLIHSVNAAASAYEVKTLYDHYRRERPVYAIDLPGYGFSDRADRQYTPRLMCDAISAVVDCIRRAHPGVSVDALALSLSCEFLSRVATERTDAIATVALVSPTGFNRARLRDGPPGGNLGKARVLSLLNAPLYRRGLYGLLTRRGVIRYFLERTWGSRAIDEGMLDYDFLTTRPAGSEYAPLHFLSGYLFSADSGAVYRALTQPVWVAHGIRGDFVNYKGLDSLKTQSNWRTVVLPTGALPHFELPAEFVSEYDTWLKSNSRS